MKREVFAWGMYDLANTMFSALFVTLFFPLYIKEWLGGSEAQVGVVFGASMLLVAIVVPFIGAWSDALGMRLPFMAVFTVLCCVLTYLVGELSLWWALVAGFFANVSYHAALVTYNALLPKIAPTTTGNVSGVGIAFGYVGTLIALGVTWAVLSRLGWESLEGVHAMFLVTAVLFGGFSLFTFFGIREKKRPIRNHYLQRAVAEVCSSLRNIAKHRSVFWFFLAMFLFSNAMNAMILFLFLYARTTIGLSVQIFLVIYALQAVGAIGGSLCAGKLSDKVGAKRVLIWCGFGWIFVLAGLLFVQSIIMFTGLSVLGGALLGAVWAAQRPKLIGMVNERKVGQFFGFLEFANKFSGIVGPVVFGVLAVWTYEAAIVSLIVFFIAGLACLRMVPGEVV